MPVIHLHYHHQRGSSLLEVMVALFILAIGLLGFAGLQTEGITLGRQAYMHSQAGFLAQDLVERIRANEASANLYAINFDETATSSSNCGSSACTSSQMADWDRAAWSTLVAQTLPAGTGEVTISNASGVTTVTVNIRYQLARGRLNPDEAAPTDEQKTYTYTLETQI